MSNADTHHSLQISKHSEQSKKGEGVAETAKLQGTVSTNRPGVRIPTQPHGMRTLTTSRPKTKKSAASPTLTRTRRATICIISVYHLLCCSNRAAAPSPAPTCTLKVVFLQPILARIFSRIWEKVQNSSHLAVRSEMHVHHHHHHHHVPVAAITEGKFPNSAVRVRASVLVQKTRELLIGSV